MSRGTENRNPGNIRLSGQVFKGEVRPSRDRAFKTFESMEWGYRAIFVVLATYQRRHGFRSIRQMIARWAPEVENNTRAYMNFVARTTGIGLDEAISVDDPKVMIPLVMALSKVENGVAASHAEVEGGWALFRGKSLA